MGAVSRMATCATERALAAAGLLGDPVLVAGRTGIAYGSSFGSPQPYVAFAELMTQGMSQKLNATSYIQMMSHTAAVNIGLFFGITGRTIPTSCACTSGSQAIGYAFEAIRAGHAEIMLAGGADELDITQAAVFDTLYATSVRNDEPHRTPRPYDKDRDGLVIGEGATTLVLEEREHALARGAPILAELSASAPTPTAATPRSRGPRPWRSRCGWRLQDASLPPEAIGYVNGHGTATEWGDIAETFATAEVLGGRVPIHSLKSYFGHTLGACGALEAWLGIEMMREGWLAPTANLETVDARCAELHYLTGAPARWNSSIS